jgi:DNA-3-methyladenine glycosylase II
MVIGRTRVLHLTSDRGKPRIIARDADVAQGVEFLVEREPRFGRVVEKHGLPPLRRVENGLPSLLNIITEQLISLTAAAAIWRRIEARLHPFEPAAILELSHDEFRQLGLSGAKARCFHAISKAVHQGEFNFQLLDKMSDEEVVAMLLVLPGVGPWTADIYTLSALGRADICVSGDLALQVAAQDLFGLSERPGSRAFLAIAEGWRPWRSVAARLLWSHYRGLKGISQEIK